MSATATKPRTASTASGQAATSVPSTADINGVLAALRPVLTRQHRISLCDGETIAFDRKSSTLIYVIEGELRATPTLSRTPEVPTNLLAGDAVLFTGAESGSFVSVGSAFVLFTSLDLSCSEAGVLGLLPSVLTVRDLAATEPAVAALAAQIGPALPTTVLHPTESGPSLLCQTMAHTVLLSVVQTWAARGCAPLGWPSRTGDPFLDRILELIDTNPESTWSVEDLARAGAMSRSTFAQRFRESVGTTPAKYVAQRRMRSARGMLLAGRSVSEVSRAIGYNSDEGFSRAFQRAFGVTPSAWRDRGANLASQR